MATGRLPRGSRPAGPGRRPEGRSTRCRWCVPSAAPACGCLPPSSGCSPPARWLSGIGSVARRATGWRSRLSYLAFTAFVITARLKGGVLASCGCFGKADTPPTWLHAAVTAGLALASLPGPDGADSTSRCWSPPLPSPPPPTSRWPCSPWCRSDDRGRRRPVRRGPAAVRPRRRPAAQPCRDPQVAARPRCRARARPRRGPARRRSRIDQPAARRRCPRSCAARPSTASRRDVADRARTR